jgi:hypothetical protein
LSQPNKQNKTHRSHATNLEPRRMVTEAETRFTTLSKEENIENNWTELSRNQTPYPPSPSERWAIKMNWYHRKTTTKNVASEKMAGQQCCQHGTTLCSNPHYFTQCCLLFLKLRSLGPPYMMYLLMTFAVLWSIKNTFPLFTSKSWYRKLYNWLYTSSTWHWFHSWCAANNIIRSTDKIRVTALARKIN